MLRGIAYGILSRLMEHLIYMQGGRDMSEINWSCCSLVAQNPLTRAFIEQLAKERKARSTIENYSRDLNDFLSAFPELPFSELLEADEGRIADYVDWLWKSEVLSLCQPRSLGFQTNANGKPFCNMSSRSSR